MLMPSLLTTPKELEFAALFLGVYMCMGVSDRVSDFSMYMHSNLLQKPCIQLFSYIS